MNTLQKEGKRNPGKEIMGGTEEAVKLGGIFPPDTISGDTELNGVNL